ncbi:MAG TPA: CARDB domain-containing protein [Patescibacteria group bacterium]|nr:CARDB domain-containing protein [Patescibacteria group bacterium]
MKQNIRIITLISFLMISVVLLILTLIANRKQQTYRSKAQEIPSLPVEQTATESAQLIKLRGEIEEKNTSLLGLLNQYKQVDEEGKKALVPTLSQKAQERTITLLALLEESPAEVYKQAFSRDILAQFPQETQEILEKRVSTQGTVNTYIFDNFEKNTSFETATFVEDKTDEEMNFYPVPTSLFRYGFRVKATNAVKTNGSSENTNTSLIAVELEETEEQQLKTTGQQNVLTLVLKDTDYTVPLGIDIPYITQQLNETVGKFFEEESYNKLSLNFIVEPKIYAFNIESYELETLNAKLPKKLITFAFENSIDLTSYESYLVIIMTDKRSNYEGMGTMGKVNITVKTKDKTVSFDSSITSIVYNGKNEPYFFSRLIPHEIGHNLGAEHANSMVCNSPTIKTNTFSGQDQSCLLEEYGNSSDVMGALGLLHKEKYAHFGPYAKKYLRWLPDEKIIKINTEKPQGIYTIQQYDLDISGNNLPVAAWIPFATNNLSAPEERDLFLHNVFDSLMFNFESKPYIEGKLMQTILFTTFPENGFSQNDSITDQKHDVIFTVEDINKEEKTLSFRITSCNKTPYIFYLNGGHDLTTASVNIFENDVLKQGMLTYSLPISIGEKATCEKNISVFTPSQKIVQGTLRVDNAHFSRSQIEQDKIALQGNVNINELITNIRIFEPTPIDTKLFFKVSKNKESGETMTTTNGAVEYHLVPSTEEYKNDLEPGFLFEKNTLNEYSVMIKKGQKMFFRTRLRNNSRNPSGNKSRDFQVRWSILDEKGNNQIPPFFKRVDGISPQGSTSQELEWTVPDDVIPGDYRVVFEADPRGRIEEFNENNNQVWRDFTVVD